MRVLRISLAIALCLLLGVTGQAMAVAHGSAPAQDRVVICIGHAYQTIYVDAEGQPTAPPELCADCLHLLADLLPVHTPLGAPTRFSIALETPHARAHHPEATPRDYSARAPPGL